MYPNQTLVDNVYLPKYIAAELRRGASGGTRSVPSICSLCDTLSERLAAQTSQISHTLAFLNECGYTPFYDKHNEAEISFLLPHTIEIYNKDQLFRFFKDAELVITLIARAVGENDQERKFVAVSSSNPTAVIKTTLFIADALSATISFTLDTINSSFELRQHVRQFEALDIESQIVEELKKTIDAKIQSEIKQLPEVLKEEFPSLNQMKPDQISSLCKAGELVAEMVNGGVLIHPRAYWLVDNLDAELPSDQIELDDEIVQRLIEKQKSIQLQLGLTNQSPKKLTYPLKSTEDK